MDRVKVYNSFDDFDINTKDALTRYYENTDHRPILNNSYSRYPYLFDFDVDGPTKLDEWFLSNGADLDDGYVIIHWEW